MPTGYRADDRTRSDPAFERFDSLLDLRIELFDLKLQRHCTALLMWWFVQWLGAVAVIALTAKLIP